MAARNLLEQAEKARKARRLDQAQRACEKILAQFPDYVAALYTIGLILADKGEYRRALPHLVQASMLNPDDASTLTVLSGVYLKLGSGTTALRTLDQARRIKPDDVNILATLGEINREEREYAAGAEVLHKALEIDPEFNAARYSLGICRYELGQMAEAADALERLVRDGVSSAELTYTLSQLPPAHIKSDILQLADAVDTSKIDDQEDVQAMLAFARASAFVQAGRHEEAWAEALRANSAMHKRHAEPRANHRKLEQAFLEGVRKFKWPGGKGDKRGSSDTISLFILGPSRCGKTSLERLLGAHQDICAGHESPIVEGAVRRTFQFAALPTRDRIFELPPALDQRFREIYRSAVAARAGGARVFTNTHPAHIYSVLRLAHALPETRFLFVRRNRDDTKLRIFLKRYLTGNSYAYHLDDIETYLDWYDAMTDSVASHLAGRCLTIKYEDMVEDPATACGSIVDLCGLPAASGELPEPGDDRGCAAPYSELMKNG
jgi:tetratricopeptide (TPR) repeat protein